MVITGKLVASDLQHHSPLVAPDCAALEEEEMSPFTGNLPMPLTGPLAVPSKEIIESTLITLPTRTSSLDSRGLWSFSDKVPTVNAGPSQKLLSYITRKNNEGER
jgi:hypothetical protein